MSGLVGEFEVKLDDKGRFLFPSGLRKQLPPAAQRDFMLNKGFEDCLTLFPMTEWEKISQQLSKLNLFVPANRQFYRLFHHVAKHVSLDNAGRVLVPSSLAERVGLNQEVMLIAYNDRVEIWDRAKYFAYIDNNMGNFADLANEVMGNLGNDV
jgi:MraZ protein